VARAPPARGRPMPSRHRAPRTFLSSHGFVFSRPSAASSPAVRSRPHAARSHSRRYVNEPVRAAKCRVAGRTILPFLRDQQPPELVERPENEAVGIGRKGFLERAVKIEGHLLAQVRAVLRPVRNDIGNERPQLRGVRIRDHRSSRERSCRRREWPSAPAMRSYLSLPNAGVRMPAPLPSAPAESIRPPVAGVVARAAAPPAGTDYARKKPGRRPRVPGRTCLSSAP